MKEEKEFYKVDVSVVIGTFNRANLLDRCLKSVFSQKDVELEVIIVNDASTDNTHEIIKKHMDKHPDNLIYIENKENKGISFNSNRAFEQSSGKYLALIGDDDEWTDEFKLKKQIQTFTNSKQIGLVGTWWLEKSNERIIHKTPEYPSKLIERMLMKGGIICGSTAVVSRKAWMEVKGFDEMQKRGTDSDLFRRIVFSGYDIEILPEFTTSVDIGHGKRMTPTDSVNSLKKNLSAEKYVLKKFFWIFLKHPKAAFYRIRKIMNIYLKLLNLHIRYARYSKRTGFRI